MQNNFKTRNRSINSFSPIYNNLEVSPLTSVMSGVSLDLSNLSGSSDSLESRTIWLTDEVYPDTIAAILKEIEQINRLDEETEQVFNLKGHKYKRQPITLYISSYGGSCYDGLGLVGTIQRSKTPIHTVAVGKVMSMGAIIAVSGHKRFCRPFSTVMIHSCSSWNVGKFMELKEGLEETERLQNLLDKILVENSKISQESLDQVHSKKIDWYIGAEEAIDLGIFDSYQPS